MNKKNIPVVNVGISLLILIFMTLSLLTFSVLSLENAVADRRLSRKMAEHTSSYYAAVSRVQEQLAEQMRTAADGGTVGRHTVFLCAGGFRRTAAGGHGKADRRSDGRGECRHRGNAGIYGDAVAADVRGGLGGRPLPQCLSGRMTENRESEKTENQSLEKRTV